MCVSHLGQPLRRLHASQLAMLTSEHQSERSRTGVGRCKLGQCLLQRLVQVVQVAMVEGRKQMVQNVIAELGQHGKPIAVPDVIAIDHCVQLVQAPVEVVPGFEENNIVHEGRKYADLIP